LKGQNKNIIIFAAVIFLCQCEKVTKVPYANDRIVEDNAQAALYFHTVFREAENAWAFIDSVDYAEGVYKDPASTLTVYKELTYNDTTNTVSIEYHDWQTNHLLLMGNMDVVFKDSYRKNGVVANIYLSGFSINGQNVVGEPSIKYTGSNTKVQYTYTLNNAAIYEEGNSKQVLISGTISNGQYERIEGNETWTQDDDVWAYSGEMKGQLRNDPNLKYTNTVLSTYMVNGESINGKINYNMDCTTARQGISQIKIPGRSDIIFFYGCSECYLISVSHID